MVACQTSHGSYGNTKHHKKSSSKSSSSKSSGTKSAPKSSTEKPADDNSNDKDSGYKSNAQGNITGKKEPAEKRLGYGVNLGNISFYGSEFQVGLAPNIAYKLQDQLAVGFMLKLDYYYYKDNYYQLKYSSFDVGPTIFTRWKPLMKTNGATPFMQGLFLQAEYEHASIARPYDEFGNINTSGNKIIGFRNWEDYIYVGLGAASGYPFSTFFSVHYNILDDFSHSRQPFSYRIGFTWNY
jgi:hypothetical protein